ncbi:MAG: sigma-70 family RNA polymerase sigma factor [Chloroflexota bacterium]|nr:sigma-70 family RNA polymerase sigma factor [Chloroflexota bacterium]
MDDDELIATVASGDHTALRELFDRHSPWIAGRLRRGMPAGAVEDVVQETFIAVWRGARSYSGRGEVGVWMWGIARRQAAMWARKAGGRAEAQVEAELDRAATEDFAPGAVRRADLHEALASLGPEGDEQRELARLVFEEDRTVADVAERLGIPEGTVKSRVFKVRQRLQAALRQGGY